MDKRLADRPLAALPANHPVLEADILSGLRLLEADAGTGKTWTIARLVLRAVVEKDIAIDQIAVLTFTNAAAAELRDRIGALFDQWLTDSPELEQDPFTAAWQMPVELSVMKTRLRLARLQLDDASIGTIHGFCHRVMTENALSIGRIDRPEPGPSDSNSLQQAIATWWRDNVANSRNGLARLCGRGGLSRSRLSQLLEAALADSQASIRLPLVGGNFNTLAQRLDAAALLARETLVAEHDAIVQWVSGGSGLNQNTYRNFDSEITAAVQWLNEYPGSIQRPCKGLLLLDRRRINGAWNAKSDRSAADHFTTPDRIAELVDLLRERCALPSLVATAIRDDIAAATQAIERASGTISFDDMLEQTRRALNEDELGDTLGAALRNQFLLTFVDEFQDTDPAQWAVFEKIYRPNGVTLEQGTAPGTGLILVGDPKQAIYSFRNADIHTYLHARDLCQSTHRLENNHRSNQQLIGAINEIFSRDTPFASTRIGFMPALAGRVAQSETQEPPSDGRGAFCFIQLGDADQPATRVSTYLLDQRAVQATCNEIAQLIDNGSARAADIAVLVPSALRGGRIRDGLLERGIGAVEIRRDSVFATNDALDLFRVVSAIAAPARVDLARGALITALIGADLGDLNSLSEDPAQWQQLLLALDNASRRWVADGPQAALRGLILGHFKRAEQLMSVRDGERRLTNLLHLLSLLNDEPAVRASAAQGQAWLGRQINLSTDPAMPAEERQLRLESDDDLVRIMTIHTSKGLQFPFVFLPFTYAAPWPVGKGIYRVHSGDEQRVIVDGDPGPWIHNENLADVAHFKGIAIHEQFQESLRLSYVALTRAQRRCYVCWGPADKVKSPTAMSWLLDRRCPLPTSAFRFRDRDVNAQRIDEDSVLQTVQQMVAQYDAVTTVNWQQVNAPDRIATAVSAPGADLQLGTLDREVSSSWQSRSFTSLARAANSGVTDRPDHDQDLSTALIEDALTQPGEPGRGLHEAALSFPRGANSGTCLHSILEQVSFSAPVPDELVKTVLDQYGLTADPGAVADWLTKILNSALPDPNNEGQIFRLAEFSENDAIRELPYTLSANQLNPAAIAQCIGQYYAMPSLGGSTYDGFLTGYIDLIVRASDGRYWVLDYKSNWLGDQASDYTMPSMNQSMTAHAYTLQMCLYSLAIHRMLRQKQADYDYDKHFGGVWYLFLRGMDGSDGFNGVYSAKPPLDLLEQLDELVGRSNV